MKPTGLAGEKELRLQLYKSEYITLSVLTYEFTNELKNVLTNVPLILFKNYLSTIEFHLECTVESRMSY